MSQKGIKAFYYSDNSFSLDGDKMELKDNVISCKNFRVIFRGAMQFIRVLQYEGYLIGADASQILMRYNYLVQTHCLNDDMAK